MVLWSWSLLSVALIAQAPAAAPLDVALVTAAWPGVVTIPVANRIEAQVRAELTRAGFTLAPAEAVKRAPGMGDACKSDKACLARVGLAVGARVVLLIEPASVGKEVAVVIQSLVSADGSLAGEESFSIALSAVEKELRSRLSPLLKTLESLRPVAPQDAPVKPKPVVVVPEPLSPPLALASAQEEQRRPVLPWVLGGGALAAGVASGVFAGLAASSRSEYRSGIFLQDGMPATRLTQPEVDALVARTNTDASVALATGIGAGVLALGAVIVALLGN